MMKIINELLKKKSGQVGFLIFSILLGAWSIYGIAGLARESHTRALKQNLSAAMDELEKSPPGIQRAEAFLKKLRAIDPGYAPAEVKQALHDYISALEQALNAWKAGQTTERYDVDIEAAKKRLIDGLQKIN